MNSQDLVLDLLQPGKDRRLVVGVASCRHDVGPLSSTIMLQSTYLLSDTERREHAVGVVPRLVTEQLVVARDEVQRHPTRGPR